MQPSNIFKACIQHNIHLYIFFIYSIINCVHISRGLTLVGHQMEAVTHHFTDLAQKRAFPYLDTNLNVIGGGGPAPVAAVCETD